MKRVNRRFKHLSIRYYLVFQPKKSKEPRLEPRLGNQYGGKLVLILDDGLEIEVERIKGSAQGDVKVYLPNGAVRDDAWLQKET